MLLSIRFVLLLPSWISASRSCSYRLIVTFVEAFYAIKRTRGIRERLAFSNSAESHEYRLQFAAKRSGARESSRAAAIPHAISPIKGKRSLSCVFLLYDSPSALAMGEWHRFDTTHMPRPGGMQNERQSTRRYSPTWPMSLPAYSLASLN